MHLIVNIDDVGLHPAVQRAVEAGAERGVVTSASLVANGPFLEDARAVTGIGLAAHLNLLRGEPLSPETDVPSLVGPDGKFLGRYMALFWRYYTGGIRAEEVELEWDRQIQKLLDMGFSLTHLDSEKHIHAWPGLMAIACRLAKKHGLRWVRRPREAIPLSRLDAGAWRARALNFWCSRYSPPAEVSCPDAVWGIADMGRDFTVSRFRQTAASLTSVTPDPAKIADQQDRSVLEIICHPGDTRPTDPPLPAAFGPMKVESLWQAEFQSLMQEDWLGLWQEYSFTPTHYGKL